VDGKHRVEEMSEPDAVGLGDQTEQGAVTVEAPRAADREDLEALLVVPGRRSSSFKSATTLRR
jgi:hypothetical protein